MLVVLSATLMLVDLFVAVIKVTVFVAIMQLEVSVTLMQVKVSAANMWVAIIQMVFSTMHYAHDYFYCNYTGGCFRCSHLCDSFKQQLYIPFSNWHPFFTELTRKHLKALIKFAFHRFSKYSSKIKILCGQSLYTNRLKNSFITFVFLIGL